MELDFSGIDQSKKRKEIDRVRKALKSNPTLISIFKDHDISIDEIDLIPMAFAKMPVSARTEHGIIYFNTNLDAIDDYMVHEVTHFAQQTSGDSAVPSSDAGSYLDNEEEIEAFQNQIEYISDEESEDDAKEYANNVLDHHDVSGDERRRRFNELTRFASIKTAALNEKWARDIIVQAFRAVMGRDPTPAEAQGAQAVARLESSYGQGWRGAGVGSNNWGAVQTRGEGFNYQDSYTNRQGQRVTYNVNFKRYPTPVDGAKDVISHLFKSSRKQQKLTEQNRAGGGDIPGPSRSDLLIEAAQNGDLYDWSKAMWWTTYYEGFGAKVQDKINNHVKTMTNSLAAINAGCEESPALTNKGEKYLPETTDQQYLTELSQKLQITPTQALPAQTDGPIEEIQSIFNFLKAAKK